MNFLGERRKKIFQTSYRGDETLCTGPNSLRPGVQRSEKEIYASFLAKDLITTDRRSGTSEIRLVSQICLIYRYLIPQGQGRGRLILDTLVLELMDLQVGPQSQRSKLEK